MTKKFLIILIMIMLIIMLSFVIHYADIGMNKSNEIENCNIPFLSPSDFLPDRDFFNQSLFSVYTITKLNREIYDVTSVDFNDDGFMDVIITGSRNVSKIYILYYHGNWNFTYEHIYSFENDISGLVTSDYDNDGDIDIIFCSGENKIINGIEYRINGTVNILLNDGEMNFTRILISKRTNNKIGDDESRINPRITSADYDNDGDMDLLIGDNSGKVEFFINNGYGDFISGGIINDFGSKSWGLASDDFDNDGDIDFIVSAHEKQNITRGHIYLKKNQFIESNSSTCFLSGYGDIIADISFVPAITSLATIDYDNDNDLDIFVGTSMLLYILINENNCFKPVPIGYSKEEVTNSIETLHRTGIAFSDFNNDGLMDFTIGVGDGYIRLFINMNHKNI